MGEHNRTILYTTLPQITLSYWFICTYEWPLKNVCKCLKKIYLHCNCLHCNCLHRGKLETYDSFHFLVRFQKTDRTFSAKRRQPRSSCVPPPTYHPQRPESHEESPWFVALNRRKKMAYPLFLSATFYMSGAVCVQI